MFLFPYIIELQRQAKVLPCGYTANWILFIYCGGGVKKFPLKIIQLKSEIFQKPCPVRSVSQAFKNTQSEKTLNNYFSTLCNS